MRLCVFRSSHYCSSAIKRLYRPYRHEIIKLPTHSSPPLSLICQSGPLGQSVNPSCFPCRIGLEEPLSSAAADAARPANTANLASIAADIFPDGENDSSASQLAKAVSTEHLVDHDIASCFSFAALDHHCDTIFDAVIDREGLAHAWGRVTKSNACLALVVPSLMMLKRIETDLDVLASHVSKIFGVATVSQRETRWSSGRRWNRCTRISRAIGASSSGPEAATLSSIDGAL